MALCLLPLSATLCRPIFCNPGNAVCQVLQLSGLWHVVTASLCTPHYMIISLLLVVTRPLYFSFLKWHVVSAPYSIPPTWTSLILVALLCTTWSYPALARCVWLSQWFPSPPYIIYCYTTFTNNKVTVLLLHIPLEAPWTLQSPDPIIFEHLAIITQYAIWAKYLYILQSMAPVKMIS